MKREGARKNILGFMYAERLKSALIITGHLLDALRDLKEEERVGGLKMFSFFIIRRHRGKKIDLSGFNPPASPERLAMAGRRLERCEQSHRGICTLGWPVQR